MDIRSALLTIREKETKSIIFRSDVPTIGYAYVNSRLAQYLRITPTATWNPTHQAIEFWENEVVSDKWEIEEMGNKK